MDMSKVKDGHRYFDIYPRIVKEGSRTEIEVKPLFSHRKIDESLDYRLVQTPMETRRDEPGMDKFIMEIVPVDNAFKFELCFGGEQEHFIEIYEIKDSVERLYLEFSIYSLEEDLYDLRPFKGDMHIHSHYSDGIESPAYVAASCRKIGLDFMALTDHERYEPSLEAIEAFKDLDLDFKMYPGEEVHPPNNDVHMINFGGDFSVNSKIREDTKAYRDAVEDIKSKLVKDDSLTDEELDKYASCIWVFDRIREGGGLSIYCHPYWVAGRRYNVSYPLHDYIYGEKPFDAYELLGGFNFKEAESNHMQVTYYQEQRAKGHDVPVVSVTDAHGCDSGELFGWYYTIVFAKDAELNSLVEAIQNFKSVAVEHMPGCNQRAYGDYRLVKYSQFLLREVFPIHDRLCYKEGKWMTEYIAGDEEAANYLRAHKGRVEEAMEKVWG